MIGQNSKFLFFSSNPLMGSTAVAVFKHDEIMQLQSEIRIHLWGTLQSPFSNITRLCTYAFTIRDLNPLMGSTAAAVFRNVEIMQLLSEIRINL
ncbi:hypothetical protein CEXT_90851 [Caerostris extrusa]|uniref:Uncharacterized protein n=1 Tax=Caerostris extrusa TaxID=172846 RepID=A0AAV4S952_CAEEX|nr:hypothetical protein CEXT_90851 [Caerostris extrusa]